MKCHSLFCCVTFVVANIAVNLLAMHQDANVSRNGHIPFAGGQLFNDSFNPVTRFLISKYCKNNDIPECRTLQSSGKGIHAIAVTPDGEHCITAASICKTVSVWNLINGECENVPTGHRDEVLGVAVTLDGSRFITVSRDKTGKVRNLADGECSLELRGHTAPIYAVAISSDGSHCITGAGDKTVRVWNLTNGECEKILHGHRDYVSAVAATRHGNLGVSGSWDNSARIWNLITGQCKHILIGHKNTVSAVAVARNGLRCVTGSLDGDARVWNVATGNCEYTLSGHQNGVYAVGITSDDEYCLTGSWDLKTRIWNLASGSCVRELHGHTDGIYGLALTDDGSSCLTCSVDKTVRIWNIGVPKELRDALQQLTIAQVTLLMDICDAIKRNRSGTIRSHNNDGSETDSYYSFNTLPPIIGGLIKPYIRVSTTAANTSHNDLLQNIESLVQIKPEVFSKDFCISDRLIVSKKARSMSDATQRLLAGQLRPVAITPKRFIPAQSNGIPSDVALSEYLLRARTNYNKVPSPILFICDHPYGSAAVLALSLGVLRLLRR